MSTDLCLSLCIWGLGLKAAADSEKQNVASVAGEAEEALHALRMMGTAGPSLEAG